MLMYTFSERVLRKYLRFRLRGFPKSARRVMREMREALEILFAVQLARRLLWPNTAAVPWQGSCTIDEGGIDLDLDDYVDRYLHKNARHGDKEHFLAQVHECRAWMRFDPRMQIKGHDFIATLIWYVAQHHGFKSFARVRQETLEQELFSCLELRALTPEHLFLQLLDRVPA